MPATGAGYEARSVHGRRSTALSHWRDRAAMHETPSMVMLCRRRRLAVALVAAAIVALPGVTLASHSWGTYHWTSASVSDTNPLLVGDNVSAKWDPYLDQAIADWNPSTVIELAKTNGGTRAKQCRPTAGRIEACSERYGNTGWLGVAQIWVSGGHITQATTKVNDTYFNTPTYDTEAWRGMVMCQEIAHDFGLDHQDEVFNNANLGSCMDYTNDPDGGPGGASSTDPSNVHPNTHDFDQLLAIYNHIDTTSAQAPRSAAAGAGDGPGAWGQLVSGSRSSGVSLYVLELGAGQRIYTHVIWANS